MKTQKLTFRFHNPNTPENTYKKVSEVFSEICQKKLKNEFAIFLEQEKQIEIKDVKNFV